jgi:hypothetical protein
MCGEHYTRGARCPNCRKPLLRFLRLDLSDEPFADVRLERESLDLFFCWTCNLSQAPFFYFLKTDDEIEIIDVKRGGKTSDFPYKKYPEHFPASSIQLERLLPEAQKIILDLNRGTRAIVELERLWPDLCRPRNQVGGIPFLMQGTSSAKLECPKCLGRMKQLASIADDELIGYNFANNPFVQVVYQICVQCKVVGAYQQCD